MKQTVIALFDQHAAAQQARERLLARGFEPSTITLTDTGDDSVRREPESEGVLASVRHFFSDLFGDGRHDEEGVYADTVARGGALPGEADAGFDRVDREDFDTHFAASGAAYDEVGPAYRFGRSLRTDPAWQGRGWDEIEPEARRRWAERHPDRPWVRFGGAARRAWERMSS